MRLFRQDRSRDGKLVNIPDEGYAVEGEVSYGMLGGELYLDNRTFSDIIEHDFNVQSGTRVRITIRKAK